MLGRKEELKAAFRQSRQPEARARLVQVHPNAAGETCFSG